MKTRRLGRTGFEVTEISFGARWLYPSRSPKEPATPERDEVGREVVRAALRAGINHIDTAPGYPHSERLLGEVLGGDTTAATGPKIGSDPNEKTSRGQTPFSDPSPPATVIVSTKVWSADEKVIRERVKESQRLLRRRPLDLCMLHGLQFVAGHPVLKSLKAAGEVRFIGISSGAGGVEDVKRLAAEGDFDFFQLACNILHPKMTAVFPLCRAAGIGVQIMSPMYRGVLSGHPELVTDLADYGIRSLEEAALRWLLDIDPAIVPIPGTSRPERVAHLAAVSSLPSVPPDVWDRFQAMLTAVPAMQVEI